MLERDKFAKDFQNDSYNKEILMVFFFLNDKIVLATLKKHA
jgi:hypothetical protein